MNIAESQEIQDGDSRQKLAETPPARPVTGEDENNPTDHPVAAESLGAVRALIALRPMTNYFVYVANLTSDAKSQTERVQAIRSEHPNYFRWCVGLDAFFAIAATLILFAGTANVIYKALAPWFDMNP